MKTMRIETYAKAEIIETWDVEVENDATAEDAFEKVLEGAAGVAFLGEQVVEDSESDRDLRREVEPVTVVPGPETAEEE